MAKRRTELVCSCGSRDLVRDASRWSGFGTYCKECASKRSKAWRDRNIEKAREAKRAQAKEAYAANPESYRRRSREYSRRNRDVLRARRVEKVYGLTADEERALLERQEGKCAICREAFGTKKHDRQQVDHHHETGKVRGLLCGKCNLMLGYARDRTEILAAGIDYLERM